jgi:hypothetical protein
MKQFLIKMLQSKAGISSKRVMGFIILMITLITVNICSYLAIDLTDNLTDLHKTFIYTGSSLLGICIFEGIADKFKKNKDEQ